MKNRFTQTLAIALSIFTLTVKAQTTSDPSFGNNGVVITPIQLGDDVANDIIRQPDGKLIVTGNGIIQSHHQFMILRYQANGIIDSTFGVNGKATATIGVVHNYAKAAVLQSDGKIVVAGYFDNNFYNDAVIIRFNSNGTVDQSFGTNGMIQFIANNQFDEFHDIAIQPDGKIVAVGRSFANNTYNFFTVRLLTNGTLDPNFGTGGKVMTDFVNANDCIYSVLLQSGGKIVVSGSTTPGSSYYAAARYLSDGSPDLTFGTAGKMSIGSGSTLDICYGMAMQADSSIVLAGSHHNSFIDEYMFVRLTKLGMLDNTFGTNGIKVISKTVPSEVLTDVVIQPDGKIMACGSGNNLEAMLIRLNSNGTPDATFGTQGVFTGNVGGTVNALNSLMVLPDSSVIACGYTKQGNNDDYLVIKALYDLPLGVEEAESNAFKASVYPNPATDFINVTFDRDVEQNGSVVIYDATGKTILQHDFRALFSPVKIALPNYLKKGMYVLRINSGSKQSIQKFMVQ